MSDQKKLKSKKRSLSSAVVHIKATFNNTIVSATDHNGDVFATSTGGNAGFKGSRKSTPYAAQKAMEKVLDKVVEAGVRTISVMVKGPGSGRDSAIKTIQNYDSLTVTMLRDVSPVAHNGCRPPAKRSI